MTLNFQYPEIFLPVLDNMYNPGLRYFPTFGGRDSGKSHSLAQLFIELALGEKALFLCTREFQNSIKDSSKKLLQNKIEEHGLSELFYVTNDSIQCIPTGSEFIFKGMSRDSQAVKSTEGIKYCWVEEAQSLSLSSLSILGPTIRLDGSKLFFSYNPMDDPDPVVDYLRHRDQEKVLWTQMLYTDNPFISKDTKEEADYLKDHDYDDWLFIYGGQPQTQGENHILNRSKVNQAANRVIDKPDGQEELGVDVARMGKDKVAIYRRKGMKITGFLEFSKIRTTDTAKRSADFISWNPDVPIKVDDTGVGGGVTDWLVDNKLYAVDVNNGERAADPDRYPNAISEMWFHLADIIDEVDIPDDKELIQQLSRRRFKYDSKGRRCVESKDEYKSRYGHSPDKADAILLCFYPKYKAAAVMVPLGDIF